MCKILSSIKCCPLTGEHSKLIILFWRLVSVQLFSHVWLFVTPWTAAWQDSLSITNSRSLLKLRSVESVMPSNHLILCNPTLLAAFNLSKHQGLFKWVSYSRQVAKEFFFQGARIFQFHLQWYVQWFWSPQKWSVTISIVSPSICHEVMGPDTMIFIFWMLSFKPTFSLSCFTFIKRLFSSFSLSAIRVVSFLYLRLLVFLLAILIAACASSSLTFCMRYSACVK